MDQYPTPPRGMLMIGLIVLSFVMGGLGSLATLSLANSNPTLRHRLSNLSPSSNTSVSKQEKIVIEESSAIIDTVKNVSPSVVSIVTTRNVRDFLGNVFEEKGGGTGFIITNDGYILTNKHVVDDERAEYTVITADGKDYSAKVVDRDPVMDLAVVKIEASGLTAVELGNSDDLQIGQWVVAIGNALAEFQNSVTVGVVSAKDRQITAGGAGGTERLEGLIQTDAAINPGNSGGPLVNLKGQVVAITTAKVQSSDAQNIGFAIPINVAKTAIDSVLATGKIVRPMLGIRYLPITKEVARLEKLPVDHGALLIHGQPLGDLAVVPDSPAAKAGLKEGDIILKVNGEEITEKQTLAHFIQQYTVGSEIKLTYLRDGQETEISVTLEAIQ